MIDIKEILSVHGVSEDGRVMLDPTDWNAIVLHIQKLEKRERDIKAKAVLDSIEYVYDENLYLDNAVKYTLEEYADKLKRGKL